MTFYGDVAPADRRQIQKRIGHRLRKGTGVARVLAFEILPVEPEHLPRADMNRESTVRKVVWQPEKRQASASKPTAQTRLLKKIFTGLFMRARMVHSARTRMRSLSFMEPAFCCAT